MKNVNKNKVLSLIIAIKRKNKNSVLLKKPYHVLSRPFGIAPQTFSSLIKQGVSEGWIIEKKDRWEIIRMRKILLDMNEKTGLNFWFHNILKSTESNFKKILIELERLMVCDNIIMPQHYAIRKRNQEESSNGDHTDRGGDLKPKDTLFSNRINTSCRAASKKLGVSVSKANKMLSNGGKMYKRSILQTVFLRNHPTYVEEIRNMFPSAGFVYYSKRKKGVVVCFGSGMNYDSFQLFTRTLRARNNNMVFYLK